MTQHSEVDSSKPQITLKGIGEALLFCFLASGLYMFVYALAMPLPNIFFGIIFFSVFTLAAIISYLVYRRSKLAYVAAASLVIWYIILWNWLPLYARAELARIAQEVVPIYPNAELVETSYSPARQEAGASVRFSYRADNPEEEFVKVKEFYSNNLDKDLWKLHATESDSARDPLRSDIYKKQKEYSGDRFLGMFEGKGVEMLPEVTIRYDESAADPINVYAHF